jgi:hypothetical protein
MVIERDTLNYLQARTVVDSAFAAGLAPVAVKRTASEVYYIEAIIAGQTVRWFSVADWEQFQARVADREATA